MATMPVSLRGRSSSGSRIPRVSSVDKQIVPSSVVIAWSKEARTTRLGEGEGVMSR